MTKGIVYHIQNSSINFYNIIYKFDNEQIDLILNSGYNFKLYDNIYVSYNNNHSKNITILEFLFKFKSKDINYVFKNNNIFDLRNDNVSIYHYKHKFILEKYPNTIYYSGHYKITGIDAYNMKNPYWKIRQENNEEYYLMYCEPDIFIKLDSKSLESINEYEKEENNNEKLTFFKMKNNYISCKLHNNVMLYIHQIIMNLYGQGKGTANLSVDHINRDPLDNRSSNLTIANRKEQQDNSKGILEGTKRNRKYNAQELPNGIEHSDLPKYVYYCNEKYNEKGDIRDFFRVERHPNQTSPISTSKSMKITIHDKLNEAKQIVEKLDNDTYYEKSIDIHNKFKLPTGFYITKFRDTDHLVYDYKNIETKERKNMKMKLPENYNLEEEYNKLLIKLNEKYPELNQNKETEKEIENKYN